MYAKTLPTTTMTALRHRRYGPLDGLDLAEVARPAPGKGEVLVRVRAAGLNIADVFGVLGTPLPVRLFTGLLRPRHGFVGMDIAGVVEAVGPGVTGFAPGDEVFGSATGSLAEYAVSREKHLATKPAGLAFADAAALPTAGLAALHGIRDAGRLRPGQRVLVNGAAGGVGSFAVQVAVALGGVVTGVTSTGNVDLVRSLGAGEVVDYTREDFTATGPYDLVLDNVENRSLDEVRQALAERGTLLVNSGTGATGLAMLVRLVRPLLLSPFVKQRLARYLSTPNAKDLATLAAMTQDGSLTPVIDQTLPLADAVDGLRHVAAGHARGKVVVTVG